MYCRTHNLRVCLYIVCGSASTFFCTLALSAAATVANIKIRYDAKNSPIRYIWDTRHIGVLQYLSYGLDIHNEKIGDYVIEL